MTAAPSPSFAYHSPDAALAALLPRLNPVAVETVPLADAPGRALAEDVVADRPSPACDVSAMDGYAVRRADLAGRASLPVRGETAAGSPPCELPQGGAIRIFTGGAVPSGADAVIRREDVHESHERIDPRIPIEQIKRGMHIRYTGENAPAGRVCAHAGRAISPGVVGSLASFGYAQVQVRRTVRVAVIVTGDEVTDEATNPAAWELRDSNGPVLAAMVRAEPWATLVSQQRIPDDPAQLADALRHALADADAVLMTGGVSMGDHDHVPRVIEQSGGRTVFHRLPIRPGKPVLAAIGPAGQLICGLPGNPVSVMVTARRLARPAMMKRAGFAGESSATSLVRLRTSDGATLKMHWFRLARLIEPGVAELIDNRGSGDVAAIGESDGFVELPPGTAAEGEMPFYGWIG